jgi:hypothetical protein
MDKCVVVRDRRHGGRFARHDGGEFLILAMPCGAYSDEQVA